MSKDPITRRDVLKTLALGAAGGSVLQVVPLQAAQHSHRMVMQEMAHAPAGKYKPKFFSTHQYESLSSLCDAIFPQDDHSGVHCRPGCPSSSTFSPAKTRTIS